MSFIGKVWKILVGIKDGLVLLFMVLFFVALFSLLSAAPNPGQVRDGALYMDISGFIVEERSPVDPFAAIIAGEAPPVEYEARELVHALDSAAEDDRIKAVVMDLTEFVGGGQVHMQEIGDAMDRVRKTGKPVFTYALAYGDDHMHLASNATEVWADPLGGAMIAGPGGQNLYYAELLDRLKVNTRIYKVGTYKAAVEPFSRSSMSDEARENISSLYGALWEEYKANVKKARPSAQIDRVTSDPVGWVNASGGDLAKAALAAGLVDKLGDRVSFGKRVAEVVGKDDWDEAPGAFAKSDLGPYLADIAPAKTGKAIGVVTVAGTIVDGEAGPGTAGGTRIADLLDEALDDDLAALVVRVDSPGGSVLASEEIRRAIERYREKKIPVAISMGNLAASGGYWVSTAGDRIFAQPETITGSIGVFAVLPTFENAAADIGVNADGYRTTPLSGQPDLIGGLTPEVDAMLQASVDDIYADFLERVSKARGKTPAEIDAIAQGRVWDGGAARQLGLVDQFGGLDDALAWAAGKAGLDEGDWHARYLGSNVPTYDALIRQLIGSDNADQPRNADLFARAAYNREVALNRLALDAERLAGTPGVQAYCLECPARLQPVRAQSSAGMVELFRAVLAK